MPDALALARRVLSDARPATGGFSGETFSGRWHRQRAYLRLYQRDPGRAAVDLAIWNRLDAKVALPTVLTCAIQPAAGLPPYVVTAAVRGQRADVLVDAGLHLPAARALGRQCARVVAVLRAQTMEHPGPLVDTGLSPGDWPAPLSSLTSYAAHLAPGLAPVGLDPARTPGLRSALSAADARLSGAGPRPSSLVHSDLNAKNLIIDPDTGRLMAVLDWEFAHAGDWTQDVGNLLRGTHGTDGFDGWDRTDANAGSAVHAGHDAAGAARSAFRAALVDAVHQSLHEEGRLRTDADWLLRAHDLDLFALLELAARPVTGARAHRPVVQAREQLRALGRGGPAPLTGSRPDR